MEKAVTILTGEPTVELIGAMKLLPEGIERMMAWVGEHRPECLPDDPEDQSWRSLFPHDLSEPPKDPNPESFVIQNRPLTDNELLVELAGRKCYDSFGKKAGKKTNSEYIKNTQQGDIPHASILYHAKMSFFFAGISRRVSHEIIRNYVGADRDEEGAPSQESTRFTHHYGFFICPPKYLLPDGAEVKEDWYNYQRGMQSHFRVSMQAAYGNYLEAVKRECVEWELNHGKAPTSIDKKRIYEAASSFLPHQAETSMLFTMNPMSIAKFVRERAHPAADLEIQRFARKLRRVAVGHSPNLFPMPWMQTEE
jgi:thymidylate synthase (FAD)